MSNPIIEIPEEIKANAQQVLAGRVNYMGATVAMAEFILGLGQDKTELKVEPFVIYKVQVQGDDNYRMGFRFSTDVNYTWVSLIVNSPDKENAYPVSMYNLGLHTDEEIKVLERWTPEFKFGIGEPEDEIDPDREVLVKGILRSPFVDSEGDVRVEMVYSGGLSDHHYVRATDVALVEEAK